MAVAVLWSLAIPGLAATPNDEIARELDTRRLIGTAHYENGDYKSAAEEFRRCIALAPNSAADRFNLALVLTRGLKYEESLRLLQQAEQLQADLLGVYYLRGIILKRQGKFKESIRCLQRVVARDPQCWGAHYNLGVCYKSLQQHQPAIAAFEATLRIDPNHPSAHYQLITLARRIGDPEEAKRHMEIFDRVKATVDESEKTVEALERSKYSAILDSPRLSKDPAGETPVGISDFRFQVSDFRAADAAGFQAPATSLPPVIVLPQSLSAKDFGEDYIRSRYVPAVGSAVTLGDYDGDGDLDVYAVHCTADPKASANRLYQNQGGGKFAEVSVAAGVADTGMGMDAIFGDYDNDGHNDLYVVNYGPNVLYRNRGDGTFEDVSARARVDEPQFGRRALFFDYDHDHDLDILVVNDAELAEPPETAFMKTFLVPDDFPGQINTLLRNNGDGTFLDQTDEAGLLVDCSQGRAAVFADFDADHDIDLLVCNADAESLFFANARLGKFTVGGVFSPPLDKGAVAAAEGDFDRDGDADLVIALGDVLYLYTNRGKANFLGTPIPLPDRLAAAGIGRIAVLDYNNDGWFDLLLTDAPGKSLCLLAGTPRKGFRDVSSAAGLDRPWGRIADVAVGDLDGDGIEDIVLQTRDRGPRWLRGVSDARKHWLDVRLTGKKVNRSGYGATVEIAAGGHYQKQTARHSHVHFGLGDLEQIDVVRVTWPNGIAQNVIRPPIDRRLEIGEQVRVSVSCTMLWADGGKGFELINEILGVGPLGVPKAPGVYHPPDCTELTKIEASQLVPNRGMYELRLTEELREITYADRFTLRVVDHPGEWEIVPNEMFTAPPFPEDKLFAVKEPISPRSAVDDRGTDVLALIRKHDGRFPTFPLTSYDGLAKPHAVTLDLGDLAGAKQIMLYLDGWIYWSDSSTVMAVAQDPRFKFAPLALQVRDRQGRWQTVIESVGLPTSKGTVVPVDLSGRFLCDDYHVRLATNMCVYFDRIFVSTGNLLNGDGASRCRVTELPVARAKLRYHGFSRMSRDRFGFERFHYDDVSPYGPWDPPQGMLTRYGEVTPLLSQADDMMVIFGPGDELLLHFDARGLPELPDGWVRDFVFYANGWVKDGDLNTALSESIGPLPFHGMSGYPYPAMEHYPRTQALKQYLRAYNTRPSGVTVGRLPTP